MPPLVMYEPGEVEALIQATATTATKLKESGGLTLPVDSVPDRHWLARFTNPLLGPVVGGWPVGLISHKVVHPNPHTVRNSTVPVSVLPVTTPNFEDEHGLQNERAIKVLYFVRYRGSQSAGIKFRFAEGLMISHWGVCGPSPVSSDPTQMLMKNVAILGGDNELTLGCFGQSTPVWAWIYAGRDGEGPFTLQFAQATAELSDTDLLTGSAAFILRANESGF